MFIKGVSGVSSPGKLITYQEGLLLPVLSSEELIFSSRHRGLIRQLSDLAQLAPSEFDDIYGALLKNFMELAQVLPHKPNGILGSMINYHFARAMATYIKYCEVRKNASALHKFAVFSAALLRELGLVLSNQRVVLVSESGDFVQDWNPFAGSMIGQAPCYKMYPVSPKFMRIESEVTLLLARQVIPKEVFSWLSDDFALFSDWVCALLDHEGGAEEITWALSLIKREDLIAILSGLEGAQPEMQLPIATEHAEAFYQWVKEGIEKGELSINKEDSDIHIVKEGVLIEKKLFQKYADQVKLPVNFLVVYAQFGNLMGIVKKCGEDFLFASYNSGADNVGSGFGFTTSLSQKKGHEGMVVSARDIFTGKEIQNKVSNLVSSKSLSVAQHQVMQKSDVTTKLDPGIHG